MRGAAILINMEEWTIELRMKPIWEGDTGIITVRKTSRNDARREGMQLACCAGTVSINVIGPDGTLEYSYLRSDNIFQPESIEAKRLHREEINLIWSTIQPRHV